MDIGFRSTLVVALPKILCIYTCAHACRFEFFLGVYNCIHVYIFMYMNIYIYMYTYIYIYINICVYMYICIHIFLGM